MESNIKFHLKGLTKKNWELLISFGIVDGEGNVFANTTKEFDNLITISSTPKYIKIKSAVYEVSYRSGCFYPLWYKVEYITNFKPYEVYDIFLDDAKLYFKLKTLGVGV